MHKERTPGEYMPTQEKNRIVKFVENTKNVKRMAFGSAGLALFEVATRGDTFDKIQHNTAAGVILWSIIIAATATVLENADKTDSNN